MEHAKKTSTLRPSSPTHDEVVTRAKESTGVLMSGNSTAGPASNPLSAYSITDSRQKTTPPPDTTEAVESMEMALKILNSLPVIPTLSGELERYRNNVSDIQQAFKSALRGKSAYECSKNWKKFEITAKVLLAVLNEKQGKADCSVARNALKQWVQSYFLLKKTNQYDLLAYPESPVKTRGEFVAWCQAVARAASIGTPTIAQDASLEHLCYIKAFNAGSAEARLFIVRDHLLGELYRKPPSYKRFLPKEAEARLKLIAAASKERLPKPEELDETHYKIIYDLVDLIRSDSKDRENKRDALADRWIVCKKFELQQLIPMLYLQDAYGNIDTKKVYTCLATIFHEHCEEIKVFQAFNLVHQYWFAEMGIANGSISTGIRQMETLAADMYPAAFYSLIEYGRSHNAEVATVRYLLSLDKLHLSQMGKRLKNSSLRHYNEIIELMEFPYKDRQCYFMRILAPIYNSSLAYILYTFLQWYVALTRGCDSKVNNLMLTHFRNLELTMINVGTIDKVVQLLSIVYATHEKKTNVEKRSIPLSDIYLPAGFFENWHLTIHEIEIEKNMPFVDDSQILVFRHFSDFLTRGKTDKKLFDFAMRQNPVDTCYRLLSLNHCTETWGFNRVIAKLLEHTKENVEILNRWSSDAGFDNFIKKMTNSYTLKYPEVYCQLMHSISKRINDKKTLADVYIQISARKFIQGHVSDAKCMSKKARELTTGHLKILYKSPENKYRILRSIMPKYYLDIYETGFQWLHSCNLSHDLDTLIRTGEYLLQNNNDPAAHLAWCCRITPFFLKQYFSYSSNPNDTSPIIAVYELQKKISSKISRLNQEMMIGIAKKVERFLENLPDDVSQKTVRKQLSEIIAEIKRIAKTAIRHQFASCQENRAKSQGDNHNLSTAESDNDISECTLVTEDIYPEPNSRDDFYKGITNFITEHIFAPKIREARSLQSAMALFNRLDETHDFNSARFTVLLIDTINSMENDCVPGVMKRLIFCLDRFKTDCERSVKCFLQYILRYNTLSYLKGCTAYFPEKMIEDLNIELEVLKTSIWVAYPDIFTDTRMPDTLFLEAESSLILFGRKLSQKINSPHTLLEETALYTDSNVLVMMGRIRSINKLGRFEKRFKLGRIWETNEVAKLMCAISTGNLDSYSLLSRCQKNKQQNTNATLIWLALESGKFDDAMLNKVVDAKLGETTAEYHFLKCLLASKPAMIMDHYARFSRIIDNNIAASTMQTIRESHAIALVFKLLGINKIDTFTPLLMGEGPTFTYIGLMLHLHHPDKVSADSATVDKILKVLVTSGRALVPGASCRLLEFILEQESRGQAVSDIIANQCCRFLHVRIFGATDEQTLYQGIALYLGKGCAIDKEEGLQGINQALASDSPIPALRMARLQAQQLFPANVLEQDCLKLFAEKADADHELYRDYKEAIFIELLFSLGESGLDWLIRQLKSAPGDDISSSRIAELFQNKLDIWRENGIESTQQPSLPEEQNVAATVTSKQPSQSAVKPESHPVRGKRTKKGNQQKGRQGRKSQSIPRLAARHEKTLTSQQLLEELVVKNKDKAVSEIPDEEITEVLKLLEQLKQKTTTAIRDLSKNRLANLVRMLPWSATILGEVIAAHLGNMTDPHTRANYARQQLERYECLISEQFTVAGGDAETQPQGAMAKTKATTGKLLVQGPVPPGVQELIKNTTQAHQETLLSGNLSKDELSAAVTLYPDLYLHYLQETKKPEINCVKSIWEGLGTKSQIALLTKACAILVTDQCGKDQDSAIQILNDEKLSNDARLSLFESLQKGSMETLLMLSEGIPDNLVRAYLERMKKTPPKQKTTRHQIRSINQWQTSPGKRLTDNLIHLLKELPSEATEPEKIKFREFREALKKDMDSKIESIGVIGTSLTTGLAKRFKASAILMELKEIAKAEAEQETLQPG